MTYELELPFPPSINHYYVPTYNRKTRKSFIRIGADGIAYRNKVLQTLKRNPTLEYDVHISITIYPPSKHRRDLDNYDGKAILDALTHAGVWKDDSQVKSRYSEWGEVVKDGKVFIKISKK